MKTISILNTINVPINGKPKEDVILTAKSSLIAVMPSLMPFITPKLAVNKGDSVKIGSTIFFDKKDTKLVFLSPTCGVIEDIVYGAKRKITHVLIKTNYKDDVETKNSFTNDEIKDSSSNEIKSAILDGGLWGTFKEFPFKNIPKTDTKLPDSIYLSMDNDEPFYPESKVYLKDNIEDFNYGYDALKKLFNNVYVGVSVGVYVLCIC